MWRKTTSFKLVNIFKSFFGLIYQIFIYYCRGDKPRSPIYVYIGLGAQFKDVRQFEDG